MTRSHLWSALVGAALVGAGVLIGSAMHSERGPTASPEPAVAATSDPESQAPRLGAPPATSGEAGLRAEIASLEGRLDALERRIAEEREALKPVLALYEAWKERDPRLAEAGDTDSPLVAGPGGMVESGPGSGQVRAVTSSLGLEGVRGKAFEAEVDRMLEATRRLEKEHAEVSVEGDTTTIRIPAYGAAGRDLERQWDDWVAANLTSEEREKLVKSSAKGALFGSRLGIYDREITIRDTGGAIRAVEVVSDQDGQVAQTEATGPSLGRDLILEDYLHLLD